MSTASNSLIDPKKYEAVMVLDSTVKKSRLEIVEAEKNQNTMLKALVLARATRAIRDQLTPMMPDIMPLVGSPLGFKTDRDREDKKYTTEQLQDVVTVALLKGFQVVGNEFNVIAGNFYATKEGLERMIREFPGMRDLKLIAGAPVESPDGKQAKISYEATWKLNDEKDSIRCELVRQGNEIISDTRIAVRVNSFMGIDGILGKAKSKMLRRIWERITGSQQSCVDDVEDSEINVIDSSSMTVTTEQKPNIEVQPESTERTVEYDLDNQIFPMWLKELAEVEQISDSNDLFDSYFRSGKYKWTAEHNSAAVKALDNRQAEIRGSRGGRSKSQKTMSGVA